jgi:MerR family mercuric resistance operon transcriptional regulator
MIILLFADRDIRINIGPVVNTGLSKIDDPINDSGRDLPLRRMQYRNRTLLRKYRPDVRFAAHGWRSRIYGTEHTKRLAFILRGRALGFSIKELREFLDLLDGSAVTCAEVKTRTLNHLADVRGKLSDLKRLEKVLKDISNQCEGDESPECPIIDALYDKTIATTTNTN